MSARVFSASCRQKDPGREAGTTVTELAVVMFILGIVLALMFSFLISTTRSSARTEVNAQAERDSEILLRRLAADLRSLSKFETSLTPSPWGTACTGTSFAAPSDYRNCLAFSIYRPTAGGATCPKTEVAYGFVGSELRMNRVEYHLVSGTCTVRVQTTGAILLDKVANGSQPLFTYYDASGKDLVAAGIVPTGARTIKTTVLKRYQTTGGSVLTFSTSVALRNRR